MQRRDFIKNLTVAGALAGASSNLLADGAQPPPSSSFSGPGRSDFEGVVGEFIWVSGPDHVEQRIQLLEVKAKPAGSKLELFELYFASESNRRAPVGTLRARHETLGEFLIHLEASDEDFRCQALFCLLCGEEDSNV